ncbi:MAG: low specificity L-threonine aldolase [Rikenellaceae bacterium]|nr:low specificity L-threonine aldolase [Rikenellaceae bacterium]
MKSFGSDNHSGIHPAILGAIAAVNTAHAVAYGDDPATQRAVGLLKEMFGEMADVYFVFNGTGANVLALKTLTRSYEAAVCAATAHIWTDECGAPERQVGCKLLPVAAPDGKLTPELVLPRLQGFGFPHHSQPRVISISQPTELGTLYTVDEIRALADLAHKYGMYLHVDGARFGNAVAALDVSPREMIVDTGVDALSFGGTKNGLMLGEAVLFLDPMLSGNAMYERKQAMQLASKMRFVSAQFEAYLTDGLWLKLATHSNALARRLAEGVSQIEGVELTQPTQVNGVFALLPREAIERLLRDYSVYVWDETRDEVRWMTSFDTTAAEVDEFLAAIHQALG